MFVYLEIVSFILLLFILIIFPKFNLLGPRTHHLIIISHCSTPLSCNTSQLTSITLNCHFTLYSPILIVIDIYLTFHLTVTSPFAKYQLQLKYLIYLTDGFACQHFPLSLYFQTKYPIIKHHF